MTGKVSFCLALQSPRTRCPRTITFWFDLLQVHWYISILMLLADAGVDGAGVVTEGPVSAPSAAVFFEALVLV